MEKDHQNYYSKVTHYPHTSAENPRNQFIRYGPSSPHASPPTKSNKKVNLRIYWDSYKVKGQWIQHKKAVEEATTQ